MSIKFEVMVNDLVSAEKLMVARLDKIEKAINTLRKSVSHIERHGTSDGVVVVPQTALPETLDKLEIGKHPQGT
jgi:hypothetical protein